jgi:hypothetical protein
VKIDDIDDCPYRLHYSRALNGDAIDSGKSQRRAAWDRLGSRDFHGTLCPVMPRWPSRPSGYNTRKYGILMIPIILDDYFPISSFVAVFNCKGIAVHESPITKNTIRFIYCMTRRPTLGSERRDASELRPFMLDPLADELALMCL